MLSTQGPCSPSYFCLLEAPHYLVVKVLTIYRCNLAAASFVLILRPGSHEDLSLQELICILSLNSGSPDLVKKNRFDPVYVTAF